jgi:PAS domain S-box-containing protein
LKHSENAQLRQQSDTIWASALRVAAGVARKATLSEADVIRAVTEELRRLQLRGSVALLDEDGYLEIRSQSISGELGRSLQRLTGLSVQGHRFDPEQVDLYHQVLTSGKAIWTMDRTSTMRQLIPGKLHGVLPRIASMIGRHPFIIAPLILANKPLGTISVSAQWLSKEDVPMVAALADNIAIAIGNVRTRIMMQAGLNRERLRNQVVQTVASALDLPLVLERVIHLAIEVTGADAGTIGLINQDNELITYPILSGFKPKYRFPPSPRGDHVFWQVVNDREMKLIGDTRHHPEATSIWGKAGVRGALILPLLTGDEAMGGLGLFTTSRKHNFNREQVEMAETIADAAAIAIKNALLYTDATRRAKETQALIHTARSISASLDQNTVLHLIAEQAKTLLQADSSRIHLFDTEKEMLHCVVALGPDADAIMAVKLRPGQGLTGYVFDYGEPILVNNAAEDTRGVTVPGTPHDDPECLILAPLIVRQRTMGAMTVGRTGLDHPFSASDLDLLTAFAAQAAVTLENAHLFGQIAAQAQRLENEVTERTLELARSESHYRALVETSLAGIIQIDADGRFSYANQRFADMLETDPETLIGMKIVDYPGFDPKVHQSLLDRFQSRLHGERASQEIHEIELVTMTGHHFPAILATSLITNDEGVPQGVTGLMVDISQQKMLEAALQAERDRLDALLTNIGDAVMVTDSSGVIEYVNPGWERLNGYTASEVLGKSPRIIQSGQHSKEFYAEIWDAISNGETWRGEVVNRHKNGSLYDAALTITPVLDETGHVINFVGVQHDISALKEIDRLKSRFVSDVSHELRTPLANIILYLDLLEKTSEDKGKVARYLETLSRESERLADLIDDLLSLSRLDARAVPFEPVSIDLNQLLVALVEDRQTLAANRGLRLSVETFPKLPKITGDDRLLSQVFTNLLSNSMNYTPDGGQITLRTGEHSNKEGDWIVVEVEDTGLGIPPDEISMIFQRFFRGAASQITNAPGTGLGLAICKEIIDRHNGQISVRSEGIPGHGSHFEVWLPANT